MELEEAKLIYQDDVDRQVKINEDLKTLREKREELYKKKDNAETEEEKQLLMKQWEETDLRYKTLRFKDTRNYSEKMIFGKKVLKNT